LYCAWPGRKAQEGAAVARAAVCLSESSACLGRRAARREPAGAVRTGGLTPRRSPAIASHARVPVIPAVSPRYQSVSPLPISALADLSSGHFSHWHFTRLPAGDSSRAPHRAAQVAPGQLDGRQAPAPRAAGGGVRACSAFPLKIPQPPASRERQSAPGPCSCGRVRGRAFARRKSAVLAHSGKELPDNPGPHPPQRDSSHGSAA
jgi:hypothetical protein